MSSKARKKKNSQSFSVFTQELKFRNKQYVLKIIEYFIMTAVSWGFMPYPPDFERFNLILRWIKVENVIALRSFDIEELILHKENNLTHLIFWPEFPHAKFLCT